MSETTRGEIMTTAARRLIFTALRSTLIWVAVSMTVAAGLAQAQGYPNRPIKLVYPFPAGGASDAVYRPVSSI
jgi:tripartite-type tricarboxylate transporter receptor subunit TctC